jgi:hypothetical protein
MCAWQLAWLSEGSARCDGDLNEWSVAKASVASDAATSAAANRSPIVFDANFIMS